MNASRFQPLASPARTRRPFLAWLGLALGLVLAGPANAAEPEDLPRLRRADKAGLPVVPGTWFAQGPGPMTGGGVENVSPDNEAVGALHVVLPHPTNPDVMYVAGVNAGIWRTENARAASPTWVPLIDQEESLSVSALAFDPTDATHRTLLAGHGSWSSFAFLGGRKNGLLRTTDSGDTWTPIQHSTLLGHTFSGTAPRGDVLLAAAGFISSSGGLFRSTDGGVSWTVVGGAAGTGLPAGAVLDMVSDPAVVTRHYVSLRFNGIYRSNDNGATWALVSGSSASLTAAITGGGNNNAEMAATAERLYVVVTSGGSPNWIGYSPDPSAASPSWVQMDLPLTPEGVPQIVTGATNGAPIVITSAGAHGLSSGLEVVVQGVGGNTAANGVRTVSVVDGTRFSLNGSVGNGTYSGGGTWNVAQGLSPASVPGSQSTWHLSIAAAGNTLWVGGDRQDGPFPNFINAQTFSGRLFRGDTTVAANGAVPSPQWEHLTHVRGVSAIPGGGTLNSSAPHADSRDMAVDAAGDLIEVDDGGVYRRNRPEDNLGDWTSIAGNLQSTEYHDVAWDANSDILIAGSQDNGTSEQILSGDTRWRAVLGGDGGDVAVDDYGSPGTSLRYFSFQFLSGFRRATYNAANQQTGLTTMPFNVTVGNALNAQFVTPIALNAVDPTRLLVGGSNSVYESFDRGSTGVEIGPGVSVNRNALAAGGRKDGIDNPEAAYVGSGSRVFRRLSAAAPFLETPDSFPGGFVLDVIMDPQDFEIVYAIDNSRVFRSADAGVLWENVTGNLDDTSLRAIVFAEGGGADRIVVGGLDGVYVMLANQPGLWSQVGEGLPHAPVWDLDYDEDDDVLVAATLGRGAWIFPDVICLGQGDDDADGLCNVRDNCPDDFNPDQLDTDLDLVGDLCDSDDDGDGAPDVTDNCLLLSNPGQDDGDGDAVGDACDNCAGVSNADQANADGDGAGDACDCAPSDVAAVAEPGIVSNLHFTATTRVVWDSEASAAGPGTVHSLFRGELAGLPVGSGLAEVCLLDNSPLATYSDFDVPASGTGFWYLARAVNTCAVGDLGPGDERVAPVCANCDHDRCTEGGPLGAFCNSCVDQICETAPECCGVAWDAACVDRVRTVCKQAICPATKGGCAHSLCISGSKLTAGCDAPPAAASCVSAICAVDPFCCAFSWDPTCRARVTSTCGLGCQGTEIEPNQLCANAAANTFRPQPGDTVFSEIFPTCDMDSTKFEVISPKFLRFRVHSTGDAAMQLVDCDTGVPLACDDNGDGGTNPRIEACLAAGDYCLRVRSVDAGTTLDYTLLVEGGEPCGVPSLLADGCPVGDLAGDFGTCP